MKALLILVGGRPIPNILTVIHEKPDLIIAICSNESSKEEWPELKQAIKKLSPSSNIVEPGSIDAFDIDMIQAVCEQEFLRYPNVNWIFNLTTATSLMTLGAYKAAEKCRSQYSGTSIQCWYLDTASSRVISLLGKGRDNSIFSIKVDQYVAAYNYALQDGSSYKHYRMRYLEDDWMAFAKRVGENLLEADMLKQITAIASNSRRIEESFVTSSDVYRLLQDLAAIGLVNISRNGKGVAFFFTEEQYKFLDGAWLELYVYQVAKALKLFDDHQWHQELIDTVSSRVDSNPLHYKELDVSLTYKAQLIAIECKTGSKGLKPEILDDLVSVADLVGRGFVVKILVTSQRLPDQVKQQQQDGYEDFLAKARKKGIYVITGERLPQIATILEAQAKNPKYARKR